MCSSLWACCYFIQSLHEGQDKKPKATFRLYTNDSLSFRLMHMTEGDKHEKGNAQSDVGARIICYQTTAAFRRRRPGFGRRPHRRKPRQAFRSQPHHDSCADAGEVVLFRSVVSSYCSVQGEQGVCWSIFLVWHSLQQRHEQILKPQKNKQKKKHPKDNNAITDFTTLKYI